MAEKRATPLELVKRRLPSHCMWGQRLVKSQLKMCDVHGSNQKDESTQQDVERRSKATEQLGKNQKLIIMHPVWD